MKFLILESTPDAEFQNLRGQGYTGSIQDMQMEYLGDQGHTGALNDRIASFLTGGVVFDPEEGLTLLTTKAYLDTFDPSAINRSAPVVLASDVENLRPATGGVPSVIAEFGGTGLGAAMAYLSDGTCVIRFGSGSGSYTNPAICAVAFDPGVIEGTFQLVVEFELTGTTGIRLWKDGVLETPTYSNIVSLGSWSGTASGGWFTTTFQMPGSDDFGGAPISALVDNSPDLRIYENQTVST